MGISFEVGGGLPTDPQPGMSFCAVIYTSLGVIYLYTDPSWVIPPDGSNTGFPFVLNLSPTIYFDGQQPIGAVIDSDEDGTIDEEDAFPNDPNEDTDTDGDDVGNNADTDDDNDGYLDINDAFPLVASEWLDTDGDNIGNNADTDDDNDGYLDINDAFPLVASEWLDTDEDGVGNNADTDDDNDGYLDINDAFPLVASEWLDTDGDNIGNNADTDDDNDSILDDKEIEIGSNPLVPDTPQSLVTIIDELILNNSSKLSIDEVIDLRPGSTMLEVSGNQATVQLQMEESSDLQTWEDRGDPATMTIPADTDTKFFRFKMSE